MVQRGRYGVTGYPTLKVFREGKASEFTGPREYRGIVEHMRKLTKPVAKGLASQKDAQEISLNAPYKLAAVSIACVRMQGFAGDPKAAGIILFSEDMDVRLHLGLGSIARSFSFASLESPFVLSNDYMCVSDSCEVRRSGGKVPR
jgi:hypothetical protein